MPVNSTHPDYDAFAAVWQRARDVIAGEDAVKLAGENYLPKLESQTESEYNAYRTRASFFNATARTVDGFLGLIFRRDPSVKLPEHTAGVAGALRVFAEDVDLMGTALFTFCKNVVSEVLSVGRCGSLVDWNQEGEQRVFVVRYAAEQIINWKIGRVDGRSALTMVALREEVAAGEPAEAGTTNAVDEFEHEMVEQIRVLKLERSEDEDEGRERGRVQCVVEIWREVEEGKTREWRMIERRVPLRLGKPLPLIPFVFHGPRHSLPHIEKLPLADMIMVNLDHYRLDADYKHGLHFTALPTAWVSGFDKGATLRIGSSTAWVSETIGAQAGFLEFTGQGLTTFERAMDRDERLMAVLGSRMLEESRRVGEAAQTVELRQSAEHGVLMTLALSLSDSISQVLRWVYWWNSTESSPEVIGEDLVLLELNTDFSVKGMEAKDITAVVAAWQKGAISQETMFDLFRRGEVLPAGRTDEEEARLTARSPKSEVRSASSTTDDAD